MNDNSVMNEDPVARISIKTHRGSKKRERTRAELLAAARKVFAERGYHDASISDITRESDVGVGTFYLHFRDKDEAFTMLIEEVLSTLQEQVIAEVYRQEKEPTLTTIIPAILHHAYEQRDLFRIALTGGGVFTRTFHVQEMITQGLSRTFERIAARGLLQEYDLPLLTWLVSGVITQGITWWFQQDEPAPETMAQQMLLLLSQGLPEQLCQITSSAPDDKNTATND